MEAASMELPLITTNSQGCRELLVENITGFLCKQKDVEDLAEKMEKMMALSEGERKIMGQKGRLLMEAQFDIAHVINVYQQAIAANTAKTTAV